MGFDKGLGQGCGFAVGNEVGGCLVVLAILWFILMALSGGC